MSTSLVGDECLWAAVFRLNGLLVIGYCSSRLRRGDARFFLGQCTLVGVSSVELLRGTAHGVQAWSRRLQCRTQFASFFFLHVVQSALGGPLVNSFRFSRFAAQTSV